MVLNYILVGVPAQGSKQTVKLKKYFTKVSREGLLFDFNLQYQSIYATFKLLAQFSFLSPLKWNNNYSRVIQEKKHQKLANLWRKMYFRNELKYSKRSDHVTDDVTSLFWPWEKLSGRTLLSCKCSLPCDETSIIYSPRPSLPTFSLMSFSPLNFNAGRKLVIFKCPTQPKPQICYLFLTQ